MCEREDVKIDVSHKHDSVNMAKFWWQFMFKEIARDYPGYDKLHIVYFDETTGSIKYATGGIQ